MTIKEKVKEMQADLDRQWREKNPYGQFLVNKPVRSTYPKGEPQPEAAWWITERRTSQRVTWAAYIGEPEKWGDGSLHDRIPGWPQNMHKYTSWEKFKKNHSDLAIKLQERNPDCGKKIV